MPGVVGAKIVDTKFDEYLIVIYVKRNLACAMGYAGNYQDQKCEQKTRLIFQLWSIQEFFLLTNTACLDLYER